MLAGSSLGRAPRQAKPGQMNQELHSSTSGVLQFPKQDLALPIDLTRDYLVGKCEYFSAIGIWPSRVVLNPERWLDNFLEAEVEHALYLLNAFMYFDKTLVDQIFSVSIRTLGRLMTRDEWRNFLSSVVVTLVTGEEPNVTDSGHVFARKARSFGIPEERIMSPQQACQQIQRGFSGAVVFVDDFVGSGNQFIATWDRTYRTPYESFRVLAPMSGAKFYYCPAFCTQLGLRRINQGCPEVRVSPGVFIPDNYGALDTYSIIWPSHLKNTAEDFLRTSSARAGIPDTGGTEPDDWRGFASLGLTVAFENSVPDATLPIIYWEQNGWRPLMRRTP